MPNCGDLKHNWDSEVQGQAFPVKTGPIQVFQKYPHLHKTTEVLYNTNKFCVFIVVHYPYESLDVYTELLYTILVGKMATHPIVSALDNNIEL